MSVVGSLPSRALGMMVFIGQHLATPDVVDELFVTCLPTSSVLTSAHRSKEEIFFIFLAITTKKIPLQHPSPAAHPWRVQRSTRNEICLSASEILLRKMKSVCDGWLHCVQVAD